LFLLKKNNKKELNPKSIRPDKKVKPRLSRFERECLKLLELPTEDLFSESNVAKIRSAYKRLAKVYHPDLGGDTEKFKKIERRPPANAFCGPKIPISRSGKRFWTAGPTMARPTSGLRPCKSNQKHPPSRSRCGGQAKFEIRNNDRNPSERVKPETRIDQIATAFSEIAPMLFSARKILKNSRVEASAPCRVDSGGTWDIRSMALPMQAIDPVTLNIALSLRTRVQLVPFEDGMVKVSSEGFPDAGAQDFKILPFDSTFGLFYAAVSYFGFMDLKSGLLRILLPRLRSEAPARHSWLSSRLSQSSLFLPESPPCGEKTSFICLLCGGFHELRQVRHPGPGCCRVRRSQPLAMAVRQQTGAL